MKKKFPGILANLCGLACAVSMAALGIAYAQDGDADQGILVDAEEETEPSADQMTESETGDEEAEKMA